MANIFTGVTDLLIGHTGQMDRDVTRIGGTSPGLPPKAEGFDDP
jgi:hypothetical protein